MLSNNNFCQSVFVLLARFAQNVCSRIACDFRALERTITGNDLKRFICIPFISSGEGSDMQLIENILFIQS